MKSLTLPLDQMAIHFLNGAEITETIFFDKEITIFPINSY